MAKKWKELRDKMTPEARADVDARVKTLRAEMPLHKLRQAVKMSQERMADLMDIGQPSVSKIERQTDMYVSTVRSYVEALGGELQIIAKMPDGDVQISRFDGLSGDAEDEDSKTVKRPTESSRKMAASSR